MFKLKIFLEKSRWIRENFQRNCILKGINNSKDDDLIIVSD